MLVNDIKKAWFGSIAAMFIFCSIYLSLFELLEVEDHCRYNAIHRLFSFLDCQHGLISICLILTYTSIAAFFITTPLVFIMIARAQRHATEEAEALVTLAAAIVDNFISEKHKWLPSVEKQVNEALKNACHITFDAKKNPQNGKTAWTLSFLIDGVCFDHFNMTYSVFKKDSKYDNDRQIQQVSALILDDYRDNGINSHVYKTIQVHATFNATMNPPVPSNSQVPSSKKK